MIKVIDKRTPKKEAMKFGELKPGTVFQFADAINSECFWLFSKPNYVGNGVLANSAVQLFGDFDTISALYDSEVIIVDAELHIKEKGETNK